MDFFEDYFSNGEMVDKVILLSDAILFLFFAVVVIYLLIYAVRSVGKYGNEYPEAKKRYRYAVIFMAYNNEDIILDTVADFRNQIYDKDSYDILVVTNNSSSEVYAQLERDGNMVISLHDDEVTNINALKTVIQYIDSSDLVFDNIILFDADNNVDENYLSELNNAFYSGCSVIQTHRVAKNAETSIAILDAVSEEINNSIFRKGHAKLGFSAGLAGSGMAFEYALFKKYLARIDNNSIEKQMEYYLLKDNYYIEYLSNVYTYDEKVKQEEAFTSNVKSGCQCN